MARKTKAETEQTRSQIIDAARRVFADKGVSRTTLEQIAAEAGVTRGAIYWHFSNKVDLFLALRDDVLIPLLGQVEASLAVSDCADPLERLGDFMAAHFDRLESDAATRQTFEVMINKCEYVGEFGELLRCVLSRTHELYARFQEVYASAAARGWLREGLDPEAMAWDSYTFFIGLIRLWIGAPEGYRPQVRRMIRSHVALRRVATPPCCGDKV